MSEKKQISKGFRPDQTADFDGITLEICNYIKGHLNEDMSYAFLQAHFSVTRHYFSVKFPQQVGMTLTRYVIALRLERVVSLVNRGVAIGIAAAESGFSTYSHFYEAFVKQYGAAPKIYFNRKEEKKENDL